MIGHYYGDNKYTIPSDGIILCQIGYKANSYVKCAIYDKNENWLTGFGISNGASGVYSDTNTTIIPVFKGQKFVNNDNSNNGGEAVYFVPYTYN